MIKCIHNISIIILGLSFIILQSCKLTKGLAEDEKIYLETSINISDKNNSKSVDGFKYELNQIPENGTKRGLGNVYVGIYNIFDETNETGFKHWVKYKLGSQPVLYDHKVIERTESRLDYYLNGKGFFSNKVSCDSITKGQLVSVTCSVELGKRYRIDSLVFPVDSTYAALKLDAKLKRAIIKEGIYYDRERLDYERIRLAKLAGDIGFADFTSDHIFYYVDTSKNNFTADIYASIITPTDSTFHTRYYLDTIHIYPNYTLDNSSPLSSVPMNDRTIVHEYDHYLDHSLIDHLLLEKPGEYYNRTKERKSINRLLDMGIFKFININNQPSIGKGQDHITQNIYLTPEKMQGFSGEFELNNRSGNFFGTGASFNYHHKNIFMHAERLDLTLSGQVETQIGNNLSIINSSDLTGNLKLTFPRVIFPFLEIKEGLTYIPRTVVSGSFTNQRRIEFYNLTSTLGKFGYKWRQDKTKYHELYPLTINLVKVTDKTEEFKKLLLKDTRLSNSFENILISGLQYNFTYSNQISADDRNHVYFKSEVETSGNLLSIFTKGSVNDPTSFRNNKLAQFSKLTFDLRKYFSVGDSDIATRLILGSGLAYGNSSELPYIKQYIIGGSNSVRAFRLRGLGPGEYVIDSTNLNPFTAQFVDQTGDLKLEANIEYRFPIFKFLKGAAFIDMGNIWLVASDDRPEGNFKFNKFYREIGVGTGFGMRLDFDFFLIRVDLAVPVRGPVLNEGFKWVIQDIDINSKTWRNNNIRLNLGIGYPF